MNSTIERKVWMNGNFVPESEAKISIYDSALMFGDMVFEMTRSFNKKQFKLREHLERLYAGIKILRIPLKMSIEEFEKHIYETIEINEQLFAPDDEHRLMFEVSRGALGLYHGVKNIHKEPNVIIADFPLRWTVSGMGHLFEKGINAVIPSQRAIPGNLLDPKIKNRSRLFYMMANIEVSEYEGEDNWALLLDPDGYIAEGTGDNFFIVKNDVIITPEGRNILRGISRAYIFELAVQLGIKCVEKNLEMYDVYTSDEAFMTGTPFCLLPVTSLNRIKIGEGKMGKVTKSLLDKWSRNVGLNIAEQIINWSKNPTQSKESPTPYAFKQKK
ncbi:MAG: aminotransferase class IV [Melioribacteraceae bacterium]|nr:aminotransferase class IV [Melioribacteraceae bacterium]